MSEDSARASHDTINPENLLKFMVTGWASPPAAPASPVDGLANFARRRAALSAAFPGELLIVPTGHEKTRANDTAYRFRPGTDFYYLTGNLEPDNVLVIDGDAATLYCEPNPGKTDATFYTDRNKGELWVGARLGLEATAQRYGVATRALAELDGALTAAIAARPYRFLREIDPLLDAVIPKDEDRDTAFAAELSEMRLIKDDLEIRELRRAIAATASAFDDVVRALPDSPTERHVEGVFGMRAHRRQRRRLRHDRGERRQRVHAALDAQRPHDGPR